MYLMGSFSAAKSNDGARNHAHRSARNVQALEALGIPNLFAYIVCLAGKSTLRVIFFAACHEKPNGCYLQRPILSVVCNGIGRPTSRRASSLQTAGAFSRETGAVIFDDLRAIQLRCGFLPKAELEGLSQRTQTPLYQIHSVASFYPHFHLVAPPKADIRVCADMSCRLNGACELRADLESRFANSRPEDVQIRDVSCLGRCDHAPAISINDHIFTDVSAERAESLVRAALRGEEFDEGHPQQARVTCASDPYPGTDKYGAVRTAIASKDWDAVISQLKEAELRGMGGAGFPTSMKWDLVRKQPGHDKYIVC